MTKLFYKFLVIVYAALCFYLAFKGMPAELAGFAVAGALALVFFNLEAFVEFSGAGFSAKLNNRIENIEKEIEPIKSKATEPDIKNKSSNEEPSSDSEESISKDSLKVLDALIEGKYSWRTIKGLRGSTKIPKEGLEEILTELEAAELVTTSKAATGKTIWGATMRGHVTHSVEHATYE